jgi:hypothetical protein
MPPEVIMIIAATGSVILSESMASLPHPVFLCYCGYDGERLCHIPREGITENGVCCNDEPDEGGRIRPQQLDRAGEPLTRVRPKKGIYKPDIPW